MEFHTLLEISGSSADLAAFSEQFSASGVISLELVLPTPEPLRMELNNFVQDGYDALYGEWAGLTGRKMLEECARKRGYRFPLSTREEVIECIADLGDPGTRRLELGRRYKSNLECYGFGEMSSWRKSTWGTEADFYNTFAHVSPAKCCMSISLPGQISVKTLGVLSRPHKNLQFAVSSVDERKTQGKRAVIENGKRSKWQPVSGNEVFSRIAEFRRAAGARWLEWVLGPDDLADAISFDERGLPVLSGTSMAVEFAFSRFRSGESIVSLASRFPELTDRHSEALRLLLRKYASGFSVFVAEGQVR